MSPITTIAGLFNIVIGVLLTGGILSFIGGFIEYIVRLGTDRKSDGEMRMKWGVATLFTIILMLVVVRVFQAFFR